VHVVVTASATPERVMNDLKSWTTRRLVEAGVFQKGAKGWSRHGGTRYVWDELALHEVCEYVMERQGAELDSKELLS
jgi:hypothetical protein